MRRRPGYASLPVLALGGGGLVVAFEGGGLLPPRLSVILLFALALWGVWRVRLSPLSPLTRLMILLYFMPFSVCLGYLFDPNYVWWYTPMAIAYMTDASVTKGMLMIGVIGLMGLLTGIRLAGLSAPRSPGARSAKSSLRTLHPVLFLGLLAVALFFSFLNAPSETIFTSVYTAAFGLASKLNFNAAFLVAYTILIALFVDAERETARPGLRLLKRAGILTATVFILIFFQLLRGDRDSFGLFVGLAALFMTQRRQAGRRRRARPRLRRYVWVGAAGVLVLASFLAISSFRRSVAEGERTPILQAISEGYSREAIWTAVLLTNLSIAAQYHDGWMTTEAGRTYVEYVRSLPPGFLTRLLGIERPIEPYRGPNFWFTDISAGGVHIVTVPFKNFGAPGVFVVLLLVGYLIGWSERVGQRPHWLSRLWYGSLFVVSAQWFWYGDMPFIREVMTFCLVAVLYAGACRLLAARPPRAHGVFSSPRHHALVS